MTVTNSADSRRAPSAEEIAGRFNRLFARSHRVHLVGGGAEPVYLPASTDSFGLIRYTCDYPNSALHEVAHWCIAGARRRQLVDYGYWYQPPPRTLQQQRAFLRVEARVQALESIFADACNSVFNVSIDDVDNLSGFEDLLAHRVCLERRRWCSAGIPPRAEAFRRVLLSLRESRTLESPAGG